MKKEKIIETLVEVAMTVIVIAVGTLVVGTAVTFMYNMVMAIFD